MKTLTHVCRLGTGNKEWLLYFINYTQSLRMCPSLKARLYWDTQIHVYQYIGKTQNKLENIQLNRVAIIAFKVR